MSSTWIQKITFLVGYGKKQKNWRDSKDEDFPLGSKNAQESTTGGILGFEVIQLESK